MGKLSGKVALVTGVTSGIGRATFELFAREGAQVVGCGRRVELGRSAAEALQREGLAARFIPADVSQREDVRRLIAETLDSFSGLDVVVNNAAVGV